MGYAGQMQYHEKQEMALISHAQFCSVIVDGAGQAASGFPVVCLRERTSDQERPKLDLLACRITERPVAFIHTPDQRNVNQRQNILSRQSTAFGYTNI